MKAFLLNNTQIGLSDDLLETTNIYFYDFFIPVLLKNMNDVDKIFILGNLFNIKENMNNEDTRFTNPIVNYREMNTSEYIFNPYLHINYQQVLVDNKPFLPPTRNGLSSRYDSKKSKFVWNQVPGATQYLISVYGISPVKLLYQNFTDSTWVYVSDLPANLNCQWVVLAMGNKISKKYSATWKFTTNAMVSVDQDLKGQMGNSYSLYPNPTDGTLTIYSEKAEVLSFIVVDLYGNEVVSKQEFTHSTNLDLTGLSAGIYLVILESSFGDRLVKRVIKK